MTDRINPVLIVAFRNRERQIFIRGDVRTLTTFIDHAVENYTIFTIAHDDTTGVDTIIGVSRTTSIEPIEISQMITQHFDAIKAHPIYSNWPHELAIESNMSYIDADRAANEILMCDSSIRIVCDTHMRYGTWTTLQKKQDSELLVHMLLQNLNVASDAIVGCQHLDDVLDEFVWQLACGFYQKSDSWITGVEDDIIHSYGMCLFVHQDKKKLFR